MPETDCIEKKVFLRAPRSRVWRAITNAEEFGLWFGVKLEGNFVEGAGIRGKITYPGYEHLTMEVEVERIEPERYFAYRWHPYAIDPAVDYSLEPMTLVEFRLNENGQRHLTHDCRVGFRSNSARAPSGGIQEKRAGMDRADAEHRTPCLGLIAPQRRG